MRLLWLTESHSTTITPRTQPLRMTLQYSPASLMFFSSAVLMVNKCNQSVKMFNEDFSVINDVICHFNEFGMIIESVELYSMRFAIASAQRTKEVLKLKASFEQPNALECGSFTF
ncbi:hypothetical protein Tco_0013709 [Tanacetum coccineum]